MDVSILTLTLNHPDYVERLSQALAAQTANLAIERVLVNNGARGRGLIDPVSSLAKGRGWRVLEPGSNLSYSAGNNLAAEYAWGEYLLLLNDDAIPEPDFIAALWGRRGEATVQGALHLHADGTVNHAGVQLAPWPAHIGRHEPAAKYRGKGLRRSDGVTFAAAFLPRDVYLAHGGLDEGYWYGFEDTDLCCRLIEAGKRIGVNLDAVTVHGELGTRQGGPQDRPNIERFAARWSDRLPALVARHAAAWGK